MDDRGFFRLPLPLRSVQLTVAQCGQSLLSLCWKQVLGVVVASTSLKETIIFTSRVSRALWQTSFGYVSTPGFEPGLSRPQHDVLTTRRCGLLAGASMAGPSCANSERGGGLSQAYTCLRHTHSCAQACTWPCTLTTPGVEPGLSRPQRDVLTTRRCGLLAGASMAGPSCANSEKGVGA